MLCHTAHKLRESDPIVEYASSSLSLRKFQEIAWDTLTVSESLGNGEFGQVFRGTWNNGGKVEDVAIKVIY